MTLKINSNSISNVFDYFARGLRAGPARSLQATHHARKNKTSMDIKVGFRPYAMPAHPRSRLCCVAGNDIISFHDAADADEGDWRVFSSSTGEELRRRRVLSSSTGEGLQSFKCYGGVQSVAAVGDEEVLAVYSNKLVLHNTSASSARRMTRSCST